MKPVRGRLNSVWILLALASLAGAVLHAQGRRRIDPSQGLGGIAPLPEVELNYLGKLVSVDDNNVVVETADGSTTTLRRSKNTKFYKDEKVVKASAFPPGSVVSVDAEEDYRGFLAADKVSPGDPAALEAQRQASVEAQRKKAALTASAMSGADLGGSPAPAPTPGNNHPVLKRPNQSASDADGAGNQSSRQPGSAPPSNGQPAQSANGAAGGAPDNVESYDHPAADPLIEKAENVVAAQSEKLPNFVCEEVISRFVKRGGDTGWKLQDVVSAEVIYEDGRETYRDLKINGQATQKHMEELSGSWSTGEFGTTLNNLFHPATAAAFHMAGENSLNGLNARMYAFDVEKEHSHWLIQIEDKSIAPAYQGAVWIDKDTGRVLRIEMQTLDLPQDFPMESVDSAVDYSFPNIGGESVILASHAETMGCQRDSKFCSRNVIDFRNYRKYTSESQITF